MAPGLDEVLAAALALTRSEREVVLERLRAPRDPPALQPLFEDPLVMHAVFHRALAKLVVPLDVDGRTLAAVFLCGKDVHPAWVGYDATGAAVAVLLDLGVLATAQARADG